MRGGCVKFDTSSIVKIIDFNNDLTIALNRVCLLRMLQHYLM